MREWGFEVRILTRDHEPMHVHVKHGGESVVINIEDLKLRRVYMSDRLVKKALALVEEHREFLLAEWRRIDPIS